MGFSRILYASLLLALILLISSKVTARDLAETTKTTERSLISLSKFRPIRPIPLPPGLKKPPKPPRCCPYNKCRKICICCYRPPGEAMNADVQAETHN